MIKSVVLTLSLAGLAFWSASASIAEPRCSAKAFSATGAPGVIHFTGRRNAHVAWSAKVRNELGAAYATWDRATSRHMNCVITGKRYVCTAAANPCRSIVDGRT